MPGPAPMPGPAMPGMPMAPSHVAVPNPMAPIPSPAAPPPPQPAPPPAAPVFNDPFASMRPPEGKHFDLRATADDGRPSISVQKGGGLASRVILVIAVLVAAAVGFGFGASAVGRRMFNDANRGAKKVKGELEESHGYHSTQYRTTMRKARSTRVSCTRITVSATPIRSRWQPTS